MSFLPHYLTSQFVVLTLVLTRVGALVMTAPVFGARQIPLRIRAIFAAVLALLVTPLVAQGSFHPPGSTLDYLVYLGGEAFIGGLLGLGVLILFTGVLLAGQIIGQLSGMTLANVFDPGYGAETSIFSRFLFYLTLAVFLLIGGHRLVMAGLLDTFQTIPLAEAFHAQAALETLMAIVTQSFSLGVRAAAPLMTSLLLATLVLGLIGRTVPQLNIIAVGFGINSFVVLGGLFFGLGAIIWTFQDQVEPTIELFLGGLRVAG